MPLTGLLRYYRHLPITCSSLAALTSAALLLPEPAHADQGGLSFWLPGAFASLAATPVTPGWAMGTIYLHESVSAGGAVASSRAIRLGNATANLNVTLDARLNAAVDAVALAPSYTFATPVLGGQLTVTMLTLVGNSQATINANLIGSLGPIGFARERSIGDSLFSVSDVFPQATLKWNHGVHNTMVYGMMNIPIGDYQANRLVNLGLGHWSIDGGFGYTYFDPQTGHEFSFVTGATYNFKNPSLDYQNGIDWHFDWGASKFFTKQFHAGLVGYAFQQLTADSGSGATLGDFKSRVFAVGPQIGYLFPLGDMQGYVNLRGYGEFGAKNRAEGWNMWLTFAISPSAEAALTAKPVLRK
jgi:hypothetical protein